jgi:hypothetical protein
MRLLLMCAMRALLPCATEQIAQHTTCMQYAQQELLGAVRSMTRTGAQCA